mmetsp:Transcript_30575/g.51654  ORF Transcript_30575/g.51654 Transcript_30575/m.51654 type:complete len:222 (+) Transcript_30575:119-784(+)
MTYLNSSESTRAHNAGNAATGQLLMAQWPSVGTFIRWLCGCGGITLLINNKRRSQFLLRRRIGRGWRLPICAIVVLGYVTQHSLDHLQQGRVVCCRGLLSLLLLGCRRRGCGEAHGGEVRGGDGERLVQLGQLTQVLQPRDVGPLEVSEPSVLRAQQPKLLRRQTGPSHAVAHGLAALRGIEGQDHEQLARAGGKHVLADQGLSLVGSRPPPAGEVALGVL